MTKQEAIQEQIDEVMDTFDFATVRKIMEAVGWEWMSDYNTRYMPHESDLRQAARERMKDAAEIGNSSSGGFVAQLIEGEQNGETWVLMDLQFGLHSYNDGTTYV